MSPAIIYSYFQALTNDEGLRRKNAKSKSCSPHQPFDLHRCTYSAKAATFVIEKFTLSIRLHLKQLSQADNAYIISLCTLPPGIKPSHSNADHALLRQPWQLGMQAGERSTKQMNRKEAQTCTSYLCRKRNAILILPKHLKANVHYSCWETRGVLAGGWDALRECRQQGPMCQSPSSTPKQFSRRVARGEIDSSQCWLLYRGNRVCIVSQRQM